MTRAPFPLALLLGVNLLGLVACAPRYTEAKIQAAPLNVTGPAPDIVILAVSGRCAQPCVAPRDNWAYLGARGSLDVLARALGAQGFQVQVGSYASHVSAEFQSPYIPAPQHGYAALRRDLLAIKPWFNGKHPTRLVLFGHSQGATWLHHLARVNPDVAVALQIDLDSICLAWNGDFQRVLSMTDWLAWQEPSPLEACQAMPIQGRTVNAKDIVWPNVQRNLEVQSKRLPARPTASGGLPVNYIFELARNIRLDGSRMGIETFVSGREDHSAISYANSDAMQWVGTQASQIAAQWRAQDAAREGQSP